MKRYKVIMFLLIGVLVFFSIWVLVLGERANARASKAALPLNKRAIALFLFKDGTFQPCVQFRYGLSGVEPTVLPYIIYDVSGGVIEDKL